ncbi:complex I subunit 5 family protein [Halanaerobium salsuginis]|jgi:multicomponent Na+:H+ antiporter subunit D|uniref:Multicomponent Na+:H+ antiporter subunit D n=1 Tax=Halanaerobium salsuginis TaxID=29563 RepID=A0A1I4MMP0_9FIRM|nr:proton-conducting transporter membrane subunit [Halanaerobium salsuginis]SFM04286.1 multicomponent Na+:H+ antiporter subunit D [Halanaerobium salsuginis]
MDIKVLFLILVPLSTAFLIPLIDLINAKLRRFFVLLGILLESYLLVSIIINNFSELKKGDLFLQYHLGGWQPPLGINLVMDSLSLIFVVITALSLLLIVTYSIGYIGHHEGKYYVLYSLIAAASMGAILTADLFNIYVFIEMLTITSGALIGFKRSKEASAAAIKYLVYNILAGLLFFLAVLLIYFNLGTLNMADIALNFTTLSVQIKLFITAILLTSILIKMGIFPFIFWLPKSYDTAPSPVTAVLSGILSKVYLYIFIRIFWTVIGFKTLELLNLNSFLLNLALVSSLLGHIFALQSNNIKRLLAYSSIGHIGMIMAVIMLNSTAGFYGGILHIISHMFMKAGLFVSCGYLLQYTRSHAYRDFRGVGLKNRKVFIAFIILLLSMIGMPPLLGFASKWYVLIAFLEAQNYFGAFIVIFGSLTAVIYYLRYIAKGFEEAKLTDTELNEEIYSRPLLSVLYRGKIVSFISYTYTAIIILGGLSFRFLDLPLKISTLSVMNVEKYIELVLGG